MKLALLAACLQLAGCEPMSPEAAEMAVMTCINEELAAIVLKDQNGDTRSVWCSVPFESERAWCRSQDLVWNGGYIEHEDGLAPQCVPAL